MVWIVLTVILGLVGIGALFVGLGSRDYPGKWLPFGISAGCFVVWLVVTFFFSLHTVGQRQVGVVYSASGTVTGKREPGWVWTPPTSSVHRDTVGLQHEDFDLGPGNSAVSSDQQPIYARLTLNYEVDADRIIPLYKQVGKAWRATLLESRVLQDFKEVTAGFTAQQITTQREQLRRLTKLRLQKELSPYEVKVVDVFVKNLGYSDAYSKSIEAKNRQVQQALQAEAKIRQADAEAKQEIALAEGKAKALSLQGAALRKNPQVLQLQAINKLAPNAQVIICTGTTCPAFLPGSFGSKAGG